MQKYVDMESGISLRSGPEDSENKQGFFWSTFTSSMNWSIVVKAFSPLLSPVAFFLRINVELSL